MANADDRKAASGIPLEDRTVVTLDERVLGVGEVGLSVTSFVG